MMTLLLLVIMPLSLQTIPSFWNILSSHISRFQNYIHPPACSHWCQEYTLKVRGVILGFMLCWNYLEKHQLILIPPHLYSPEIGRKKIQPSNTSFKMFIKQGHLLRKHPLSFFF